jgi:maltose alpha-D-glucosyltransferase / alpha-amylase
MEHLKDHLKVLYGQSADDLVRKIEAYAKKVPGVENPTKNPLWYKHISLYITYPDAVLQQGKKPLRTLVDRLSDIKALGCNAVHILPFLSSPFIDRGFDVSNYYNVQRRFGTISDLKKIVKEANKIDTHLFMDLVFNHVSDKHIWFKKAQAGNEKYRDYFIYTKTKPRFTGKIHKKSAVWAVYNVRGKKKITNIAFPEQTGEIPHWRQGTDGLWYYHTYYPQQPDINWRNPDVFLEYAKILMYWAGLGFNFRLDAIPFIGKSAYKNTDSYNEYTFQITTAMNHIAKRINPQCTLIAETYETIDTVIKYFGDSNERGTELAYNFHLCTNIWVSIVTKNSLFIWKHLKEMSRIPKHAEWINFLRNHDELSLAYLPKKIKDKVSDALLKYGQPFREGYGISGRTYSFLERKLKKFFMAYFLLISLPGGFAIPYGDEFGAINVPNKYLTEHEKKDSRNINRGMLSRKLQRSKKGQHIYKKLAELFRQSMLLRDYLNVWPKKAEIVKYKSIFSASYTVGASELIVIINLTAKRKKISLPSDTYKMVNFVNNIEMVKEKVRLGPYAGGWFQK